MPKRSYPASRPTASGAGVAEGEWGSLRRDTPLTLLLCPASSWTRDRLAFNSVLHVLDRSHQKTHPCTCPSRLWGGIILYIESHGSGLALCPSGEPPLDDSPLGCGRHLRGPQTAQGQGRDSTWCSMQPGHSMAISPPSPLLTKFMVSVMRYFTKSHG